MAFRKRNVGVQSQSSSSSPSPSSPPPSSLSSNAAATASARTPHAPGSLSSRLSASASHSPPQQRAAVVGPASASSSSSSRGVRPSALDGRPTTSTGTPSLDALLAGHAGLALGCSLLVQESGATDYGGTLLRYYAAEGVVQGHCVHVVGVGEGWGRELPGLTGSVTGSGVVGAGGGDGEEEGGKREGREKGGSGGGAAAERRMKIAWRYERLGEFGAAAAGSGARASPAPNRALSQNATPPDTRQAHTAFCHSFDLTKRLEIPSGTAIHFIPIRAPSATTETTTISSPFNPIIDALKQRLQSADASTIHRLVVPTLLSPALYPPSASLPQHVLQFLHSLRSLLRQYSSRLTALVSLPLALYPRDTGLTRWLELLCDGVLELTPFPHTVDAGPSLSTSGAATAQEEKPQGMAKIHRLPVFHERGGGGGVGGAGSGGVGDDLAFTVSRRRFVIKPFSLPPVEGDTEAQRGETEGTKATKVDIDF